MARQPSAAGGQGAGSARQVIVHATAVAIQGAAVLLTGPSGCGKSSTALALMALGADLVSDDRTCLQAIAGRLVASAPATIAGRIEARGMGVLAARPIACAPLALVVDLSRAETDRLPPRRVWRCLDISAPLFHKVESAMLVPAIAQYLRGGGLVDD